MPEKTGTAVAKRLGRLSYRLSTKARVVVAANQAQVLGRPVDDPLVVASTREAFELYARYFVESFHLPELSDEEIVARVDCDTEYRLHEAAAAGKGGICALPHLGNWDAAGRWMKAIGLPALAVAEELQPPPALRPLRRAAQRDRDGRRRPLGSERRPEARDGAR